MCVVRGDVDVEMWGTVNGNGSVVVVGLRRVNETVDCMSVYMAPPSYGCRIPDQWAFEETRPVVNRIFATVLRISVSAQLPSQAPLQD